MKTLGGLSGRRVWPFGLVATAVLLTALLPAHAKAQDRALIVAIDRYADSRLSRLPSGLADNDVASIEKLLVEKLGYEAGDIRILRNEEATKEAILSALEYWLNGQEPAQDGKGGDKNGPNQANGEDARKSDPPEETYRSYFYFAGFGYFQPDADGEEKDGLDETLIPHDARVKPAGKTDQVDGMISDDELAAALSKLYGRHVTLVLDTCHSGFVTRARDPADKEISRMRVPRINGAVRSAAGIPRLEAHKREGPFVDVKIPYGSLTVWSAASPTQTALIAAEDAAPRGLFTLLYAEGLAGGKADANDNGILSNVELLRHVSEGSAAYCLAFHERCEMGLRPRLDPAPAYGEAAWVDRNRVTRAGEQRLTLTRLMDFLGGKRKGAVAIKQVPPSPLYVGTGHIRYEIYGPATGQVVLLNLTGDGKLFQLYPNQYSDIARAGNGGARGAGVPLVVPDEESGVAFSATEPAKGHIVSVVTPDPVTFGPSVTDRPIGSVSPDEAIGVYLAELAAALHQPVNADSMQANTRTARWTVNVLPYEILPLE